MSNTLDAICIESIDLEAQGVAHDSEGRVVFVENALPNEWIKYEPLQKKSKWSKGVAVERFSDSHLRVAPVCEHFGFERSSCGGCKMQHVHPAAQISHKQRSLIDQLWHLGKCKPNQLLRPITGASTQYRHRGRLSARYVEKKDEVLIGFHERNSRYIADMQSCSVIPKRLSDLLLPLRQMLHGLEARTQIPQIEFAFGEAELALVIRHLSPLSEHDRNALDSFSRIHLVTLWLQSSGPDSIKPFAIHHESNLYYDLNEYGIRMPYFPTDFTQVNHQVNQLMIRHALELLSLREGDRVIDWFCGLGNFTLPLATKAVQVLGIEGSEQLIHRAKSNWQFNQNRRHELGFKPLAPTDFVVKNLFDFSMSDFYELPRSRLWLWDPPREGAFALAKALAEFHQTGSLDWSPPERIVYVSCNPSTLARDAGLLVHQAGYECTHAGVIDMFPHTAHVESLAVFQRKVRIPNKSV